MKAKEAIRQMVEVELRVGEGLPQLEERRLELLGRLYEQHAREQIGVRYGGRVIMPGMGPIAAEERFRGLSGLHSETILWVRAAVAAFGPTMKSKLNLALFDRVFESVSGVKVDAEVRQAHVDEAHGLTSPSAALGRAFGKTLASVVTSALSTGQVSRLYAKGPSRQPKMRLAKSRKFHG